MMIERIPEQKIVTCDVCGAADDGAMVGFLKEATLELTRNWKHPVTGAMLDSIAIPPIATPRRHTTHQDLCDECEAAMAQALTDLFARQMPQETSIQGES